MYHFEGRIARRDGYYISRDVSRAATNTIFRGTYRAPRWLHYYRGMYRAPRWMHGQRVVSHAAIDAWTYMFPIGPGLRDGGCVSLGHNKRGCPQRVESSTREEPSNTDKGNGKTSGLGRPKKAQTEGEPSTKRLRGRPPAAPSASPRPAKRSRGRPPAAPSASPRPAKRSRGKGRQIAAPSASPGPAKRSRRRPPAAPSASAEPSASVAPTKGARGRPPIAPAAPNASATPGKSARGKPLAAPSAPLTCPSPANYNVGSSIPTDYQLTNSNKGRGRSRGNTTSYKRQAIIGMGVFQAENGFKALNIHSLHEFKEKIVLSHHQSSRVSPFCTSPHFFDGFSIIFIFPFVVPIGHHRLFTQQQATRFRQPRSNKFGWNYSSFPSEYIRSPFQVPGDMKMIHGIHVEAQSAAISPSLITSSALNLRSGKQTPSGEKEGEALCTDGSEKSNVRD
uniref:Uncharacterized protein n=1 Tax=Solanum tuberosum TaxID=4113 RepID=M1A6Y3_SOLTU